MTKPVGYIFELARSFTNDREFTDWGPPQFSFTEPCVPAGTIRNLRTVYEAPDPITIEQMADFSQINRRRCEASNGFNHPLHSWSLSDWFTATMGELGEAANVAKKLNRVRDGIKGNDKSEQELRAALADELADTFIYLDLLAQSAGIALDEAVPSKFNKTSRKIGYPQIGMFDEQE